LALINEIPGEKRSRVYKNRAASLSWIFMARPPHLDSDSAQIKAFIIILSRRLWHGLETNPMLQRIYGTCFESKQNWMPI